MIHKYMIEMFSVEIYNLPKLFTIFHTIVLIPMRIHAIKPLIGNVSSSNNRISIN